MKITKQLMMHLFPSLKKPGEMLTNLIVVMNNSLTPLFQRLLSRHQLEVKEKTEKTPMTTKKHKEN